MVKNKPPKRPLPSTGLKNALGRLGEIVKIGVQHPTTACLTVMAASSIARLAILSASKKENLKWESTLLGGYWTSEDKRTQMQIRDLLGLYEGAQALGLAAALAPVATAGLGVLGQVLTPKPKSPTEAASVG